MPPSPSRVAVVIATRNRGPELLGTLTRLRALSERPRIVVVDNGSTDGTAELVRARHPDVQVVCQEMADSPLQPADDLPGPPLLGFIACGAVVRRDAFLEVGGFDARLGVGGEEELLALDLAARGWGLAYVDEVVAHHYPSPSRDPADRRRLLVRNALWSAWLRRPLGGAARQTAHLAALAIHQPGTSSGLLLAILGLPWVLRERRPVSRELEAALRTLAD
jgi:N-acetylglucosaminyl-diphospho-decaprenol L-rhamnosyltransferase